jgi:hypothetical protein
VAATGPVFLGAALAVGWTVAEILSVSLNRSRIAERLVRAAPLCVAAGLSLAAVTQERDAPRKVVGLWPIALCIAGCGVAMAWPRLSAWLMRTVDDPLGGGAAAAAINTVRLISGAFGAGLAGVVVSLTTGELAAARWLFAGFAVLTAIGMIGSFRTVGR